MKGFMIKIHILAPTIAYHWDQVSVYTGSSHVQYKCYVNELDTLTAEQTVLQGNLGNDKVFQLRRARRKSRCCIGSVEGTIMIHRRANKHHNWIALWNQKEKLVESENRPHNDSSYQKYLVWYGQHYLLKLKPGWTKEEWSELVSKDRSTAEGYHDFNMDREFLMCVNDVNVALSHPSGSGLSEGTLRTIVHFKTRFHKWEAMLSCHGHQSVDVFTVGTSLSSRARRCHLTIDDTEEEEQIQQEQA
ncbi:Alpha-L-arabinofuranosidase 1 [Hordeum vulgare]|nr:Alpha-L-arabinofuranosidase 1 [Hordeum vulgare]